MKKLTLLSAVLLGLSSNAFAVEADPIGHAIHETTQAVDRAASKTMDSVNNMGKKSKGVVKGTVKGTGKAVKETGRATTDMVTGE